MICEGQRTKNDVLNETIEEYKEVYMKTKQQFATLIDSVREFIEGNGGGPAANANQGGGPGNGHNGGGGGNNNGGSDDDDDSDGGGRGGRGRGTGRGRGAGGRGGGAAPGTRNQVAPARNAGAPAARGGAANRGGRGGGAGPSGNGRPFPKKDDNDENHFDGGQGPQCGCQQPTVERTVFKEGPNTGRKFWSCSKPRDEGCGFFEWADGQQNGGAGGGGAGGGSNGSGYDRTIPKKRTAADIVSYFSSPFPSLSAGSAMSELNYETHSHRSVERRLAVLRDVHAIW
jgi:DNA topoisomerase-3